MATLSELPFFIFGLKSIPVEEPVVEEIKEEPVVVNIDMTETNELLKDLISAVNKLGNIEMQNLEYLKELRDLMK